MNIVTMPNGQKVDLDDPTFDPAKLDPTQFDPSVEDPLGVLVPFLRTEPKWVVIGGLGDVDDIGPALKKWPNARFIGIDPDPRALVWQQAHNWPKGNRHPLIPMALDAKPGKAKIFMDSICCPSMHPDNLALGKNKPGSIQEVETTTLDALDDTYRFEDAILWLDLEGWDYHALRGAGELLASGRVQVVNVELWHKQEKTNEKLRKLLEKAGFELALTWFRQWWGVNEAYRRKA